MFTPIRTERLLIRQATTDDAQGLADRRNEPEVARYQNWTLPYPLERARNMLEENQALDGPQNENWWMGSVCDPETGEVLGDLVVHLTSDAKIAEVGYTFHTRNWGKGYAVEGLTALVEYLFGGLGVTRVFGMLHPDNIASAMVLERVGMLFEGHTRGSFWLDGEVSDDLIYGMTRPDWEKWVNRPRHAPSTIELVPVTLDNHLDVARLTTHKSQEEYVAPMVWSYVDAMFPEIIDGAPAVPWMRGVTADGDYVAFVMLALVTDHHPEPYLWRLLIDRLHQRRGIGHRVLDMIIDECREMGAGSLLTSWVDGKGSPRPFYLAHGFEPTGQIVDGEIEARLRF